ncbi:MAG: DUF3458 domain-containing protein, partial [Gorillibacterium sp.]|nr:DUF3458 domain-containing protein [Gorillibacterium sp.]
TYALTFKQTCSPTPGQPEKRPMHIPVAVGLISRDGADVLLRLAPNRCKAAPSIL